MLFQSCFGGSQNHHANSRSVVFEKTTTTRNSFLSQQTLLKEDDPSLKNSTRSTRSSVSTASSSTVLLEVVGATALQDVAQNIDTFCLIKVNDKEVHRTKTIPNDYQPIFTCKTKSLCLLKHIKADDQVLVQLCRPTAIALFNVIGSVSLTFDQLVNGEGKRQEFNIVKDDKMIRLALRFRVATQGDLLYFSDTKQQLSMIKSNDSIRSQRSLSAPVEKDHAADIDFKNVTKKSILQQHQKTVKVDSGKETAHRVFPGPDPDDPDNTTFMTQSQMDQFLTEPSKHWVEAGWGDDLVAAVTGQSPAMVLHYTKKVRQKFRAIQAQQRRLEIKDTR